MSTIPPHIYLIGAFIAWAGLMLTWAKHIIEISEQRRLKAVEQGESPPDIKGVSNYERADIRESLHRAQYVTQMEKRIGLALFFGTPTIIVIVFLTTLSLN